MHKFKEFLLDITKLNIIVIHSEKVRKLGKKQLYTNLFTLSTCKMLFNLGEIFHITKQMFCYIFLIVYFLKQNANKIKRKN